jgi:two-component system phosphate regulon sensor histidine kinase PhoR
MWRSRTFWWLFGTSGALVLSAIVLLGLVVLGRVEREYLQETEHGLRREALLVSAAIGDRPGEPTAPLQERIAALGIEVGTRITLLAEDGRALADSEEDPGRMDNHTDRDEVRAARTARFGVATRLSSTVGQPMMYVALRRAEGRTGVAYVRVARPLDSIRQRVAGLRRVVWTAAGVTGLAALGLAFWLARRISRPLQELTHGAEHIAAGGYGHKVYAVGHDEVGTLSRSFNNMSDRLAAQFAQLEADRQQLRAVLSGMVEGVVALDAEQRILFANERAGELLEFQTRSPVGRRFWEVVRQRGIHEVVRRALNGSEPHREELDWEGATVRRLAVHAARLPGSPASGAVLVLHDTSDLRRLERLRQEFVANVSHELKTPLAVIKACAETLLDGAVDDPDHRGPFLEQIAHQAERLHALILDLLSLARLESGTEQFDLKAVPLGEVIADCLARHRARAEGNNQTLEAVPPAAEVAAWADEEALGHILDNLVDNALKYTPPGGHIRVRWRGEPDQVCLEVEDTGIGIPERDLPRIFERFYRVDKARSRELGGTGLGLSIVKHLAQALQGSVRATSHLHRGSTFTVRLPRAPLS